jgi:hypothetical protein
MSLLHYLTTDPVNGCTAATLAAQYDLDLEVVEPRDLPRLERERADVILDWDALSQDYQTMLLNGTAVNIVAIHSYNLSDGLASFLPRRGIVCGRRLDEQFFEDLCDDLRAA